MMKENIWYILDGFNCVDFGKPELYIDEDAKLPNPSDNYDFKKFKWGDSKEKVISFEGEPSAERNVDGRSAYYLAYDRIVLGLHAMLAYYFSDQGLVQIRYLIIVDHQDGHTRYIDDYMRFKNVLSKKYGDPQVDLEIFSDYDNVNVKNFIKSKGDALWYNCLSYSARWLLDRMEISMNLNNDNDDYAMTVNYRSIAMSDDLAYYDDI